MPIIYLKHSEHGNKIATMEQEAEFDEQNGWTRYTVDTPTLVVEVVADEVAEPTIKAVNTLKPKTRRKIV